MNVRAASLKAREYDMTYARASDSVDIATKEQEVYHDVHNLEE